MNNSPLSEKHVSLKAYLTSGVLDGLKFGMTKLEIEQLLGSPDDTGGVSRKYKQPSVYLYGNFEVHFDWRKRNSAVGFYIERPSSGNLFELPSTWVIADWELYPKMPIYDVQEYLMKNAISFVLIDAQNGLPKRIQTVHGLVSLVFDEYDLLHSLDSSLPIEKSE